MSRVSPLRLCTAAGLAAGTVAAGVALAPTAFAAPGLPAPTAPASVVAGQAFTVSGSDCATVDPDYPAAVFVFTDVDLEDPSKDIIAIEVDDEGDWTASLTFPAGTTGAHEIYAECDAAYAADPVAYPTVAVTVGATASTPTTSAPSAAPTTPATGQIRGTSANTAGVASPDTGAATGDRIALGQKVVKILTGFKPGEVVTVTLHSTPQTVGTFTADASGTVRVEFTVPAGTPTGDHTLVYEGNQGTYFQEAFAVTPASGTSSPSLAYTGASVALPLGLGAGALALGGGLVFLARRRSAGAAQA